MYKPKWVVVLRAPTTVENVLRNPVEGSLIVSEEEAERLFENGLLVGEPEPETVEEELDDSDGLDNLTIAALTELAAKDSVPLDGATKKAEIIAAIRKHRDEAKG